jgi:hypothetical protein
MLATRNNTKEERDAINAEWAAAYPDPQERRRAKQAEQKRKYAAENKEQIAEQNRKYKAENKEKVAEQRRKYYEENKEKVAEQKRKYYEENKEKVAERRRKYKAENKEKVVEQKRKYNAENKEKRAEQRRKYYAENKEKEAERNRKYQRKYNAESKEKRAEQRRKRRASDPTYRLMESARCVINHSLKSASVSKTCSSFKLLGCTGKFYREYLLNHPTAKRLGFTMENYGTIWHVDHIKPLASFNLESEFQQRQAFNYKNCRPMLATENMSKGSLWCGTRHSHKKAA